MSFNLWKNIIIFAGVFKAMIAPAATCDGNIALAVGDTGTITSPNYPSAYPSQSSCTWSFTTENGYAIRLKLTNVDFGGPSIWGSCSVIVRITTYDCADGCSTVLASPVDTCLQPPPEYLPLSWSTSGNVGSVVFASASNNNGLTGFSLTYSTTEVCGRELIADTSLNWFTSNNYPSNYDDEKDCTWFITAPVDEQVHLIIYDLSIEYSEVCEFDTLTVYDGSSDAADVLLHTCDDSIASAIEIVSTGTNLFVKLFSDMYASERGFNMTYQIYVEHTTVDIATTVLTSLGQSTSQSYPSLTTAFAIVSTETTTELQDTTKPTSILPTTWAQTTQPETTTDQSFSSVQSTSVKYTTENELTSAQSTSNSPTVELTGAQTTQPEATTYQIFSSDQSTRVEYTTEHELTTAQLTSDTSTMEVTGVQTTQPETTTDQLFSSAQSTSVRYPREHELTTAQLTSETSTMELTGAQTTQPETTTDQLFSSAQSTSVRYTTEHELTTAQLTSDTSTMDISTVLAETSRYYYTSVQTTPTQEQSTSSAEIISTQEYTTQTIHSTIRHVTTSISIDIASSDNTVDEQTTHQSALSSTRHITTTETTRSPAVSCSPLPTWLNLIFDPPNPTIGQPVVYQCVDDYAFENHENQDHRTSHCQEETGEWEPKFEACVETVSSAEMAEFREPTEAKNAVIIGSLFAIITLGSEMGLILLLDLQLLLEACDRWRRRKRRMEKKKLSILVSPELPVTFVDLKQFLSSPEIQRRKSEALSNLNSRPSRVSLSDVRCEEVDEVES